MAQAVLPKAIPAPPAAPPVLSVADIPAVPPFVHLAAGIPAAVAADIPVAVVPVLPAVVVAAVPALPAVADNPTNRKQL